MRNAEQLCDGSRDDSHIVAAVARRAGGRREENTVGEPRRLQVLPSFLL